MRKYQNQKDHCVHVLPIIDVNNSVMRGVRMLYVLRELDTRDIICVNNPIINVSKSVLSSNAKIIAIKNSVIPLKSLTAANPVINANKNANSAISNATKDNLTTIKIISVKAVMAANINAYFVAKNVLQKIIAMMISPRKSNF